MTWSQTFTDSHKQEMVFLCTELYILVAYNFDSNSIHVKPLKSRHDNDTTKAYKEIYNMLTQQGLKPRLHWLDNEASKALKNFFDKEQTKYQLTPPHIH